MLTGKKEICTVYTLLGPPGCFFNLLLFFPWIVAISAWKLSLGPINTTEQFWLCWNFKFFIRGILFICRNDKMSFLIKVTSFNKCWRECYPVWMANTRASRTSSALLSFGSVVLFLRNLLAVNTELRYLVSLTCVVKTTAVCGLLQESSTSIGVFLLLCQKLRLFIS